MSEENPWKKQMMANKAPQNNTTSTNSTASISKFPPTQEQTTPPWMKKKQQNVSGTVNTGNTNNSNQSTTNSNQPAWMKNNVAQNQQNSNQSSNVPAWMKNKQQSSTSSPSQPAWMKNNTTSQPAQSQNTPAWMQNKNSGSQFGQTANFGGFGADKKKKQEEERLKKQQQQKQRLQALLRQEQQRKKAQKLKQQQNQAKQSSQMQEQDKLSKLRQQKDKQIELQRKRLQQQAKNKKNKKNQNSAKRKQQIKRCPPSESSPFYHQFLYYYSQGLNSELEYKQKLQNQIQLIKVTQRFTQKMEEKIKEIVSNQGERSVLSPSKKNKIINWEELNTQVYYAFCQGQQKQSSSSSPKSQKGSDDSKISQNKANIKFDMNHIERLQRVFSFYNSLNDILCSISKKLPSSSITKFRIPLYTLLHYKGISFLCQSYSQQLLQTQAVLPSQYKQIFNEFVLIQKQLKQKYHYNISKNDLMIKKVYIQSLQEQVYVLTLKNWDIKQKHTNSQEKKPVLQKLITDYYYLSELQLSKKRLPIIPNSEFQIYKNIKTQAFSNIVEIVNLAQSIFIVYSSCQGEVEEKQFWELILSESEQIWNLIRCTGYKGKLYKEKRLLFLVFEAYSGIKFGFENKTSKKSNTNKKQKLILKSINFKVQTYQFNKLQTVQIQKNFNKYLKQNKFELAQHSLTIIKKLDIQQNLHPNRKATQNQQRQRQNQQSNQQPQQITLPTVSTNQIIYNKKYCQYLISKNLFKKAIQQLQKLNQSIEIHYNQNKKPSTKTKSINSSINKTFINVSIKIQLLALYIKFKKEQKILKTFQELLEIIIFYYGQQTLINSILYQMLGGYYSLKSKHMNKKNNDDKVTEPYSANSLEQNVITLYERSMSITLKFYGDQSQAIAQVYLSRAIAFLNLKNFQMFEKDIQHAIKIFKSHSKQADKVAQCMFYKGTSKLIGNSIQKKLQGIQLIEQSSLVYLKLSHYTKAIDGFLLIIEQLDSKEQQNIQRIQKISQIVVQILRNYIGDISYWKKLLNLTFQKFDQQLKNLIEETTQKSIRQSNHNNAAQTSQTYAHTQLIQQLEQTIKGFTSYIQMIKWLGWTAFSLGKSQLTNNKSSNKLKFDQITKIVGKILRIKQLNQVEESQSNNQNDANTDYMDDNLEQQKHLSRSKSQISSSSDSPIKKYTNSQNDRNEQQHV